MMWTCDYDIYIPTTVPDVNWPIIDHKLVMPGDVLWDKEGHEVKVLRVEFQNLGYVVLHTDYEGDPNMDCTIDTESKTFSELTRVKPKPDSWERLAEDARKDSFDYWECYGFCCEECPAVVDGKTPCHRYDTISCTRAMSLDILARAKALAKGGVR